MPNFDELLRGKQAAKLMGDTARLERLRDAPETQKIFAMLSRSTGGKLEEAAGKAAGGDSAQLVAAIRQLMQDPEGQKLIQQMKQELK